VYLDDSQYTGRHPRNLSQMEKTMDDGADERKRGGEKERERGRERVSIHV
jgi:hypothetical protein